MKITYTERNGHTYAYRCTSARVPGRKNPVSRREYIGVVDPETGEIIPKKGSRAPPASADGCDVRVADRGNVLLALKAAEAIGLDGDLEASFGEDARAMLAVAVALAVRPSFVSEAVATAGSTCLAEAVGLDGKLGKVRLAGAVDAADAERTEAFFRRRESACGGRGAVFGTPLRASTQEDGLEAPAGGADEFGNRILMSLSEEGLPVSYRLRYGSENERDTLAWLSRGSRRGLNPTIVVGGGSAPAVKAEYMALNGMDFVMFCPVGDDFTRSLIKDIYRLPDLSSERQGRYGVHRVMERAAGASGIRGERTLVPDGDPRFAECRVRMRAFACVNLGMNAEFRRALESRVSGAKGAVQGESPDDPDAFLVRESAGVSRFLRYEVGGDGSMKVRADWAAVSETESEAGAYVVLSTSRGWEESLELMTSCSRAQAAATTMVVEYEVGRQLGTGPRRMGRLMFLQFLAVCIRASISRTLAEGSFGGTTVGAALQAAASYKDVYVDGSLVRTSPTAEARALFDLFGVEYRGAAGGGPAETMNTPHPMEAAEGIPGGV